MDPKKVPDYYQIIKEPMDLERVLKKLMEGAYRAREDFKGDIAKIFKNARSYNQEETIYYKYANQLENHVKPMLERLKEPVLDPATGEPVFLQMGGAGAIHTRRSRGAALAQAGDVEMPEAGEESNH